MQSTRLDADSIEHNFLANADSGVDVTVLPTVGSTNTWLSENRLQLIPNINHCHICAAEQQTAGRGRSGKTWHSGQTAVTFSLLMRLQCPIAELSGLSLICGAAVCDGLRDCGIREAMVKWPNDILVNGKKLAGILVEISAASDHPGNCWVVVGIGINYRFSNEYGNIDQLATDMATELGNELPHRSALIGQLAARVSQRLCGFDSEQIRRLAADWSQYDALDGRQVLVKLANGHTEYGLAVGIGSAGHLAIETVRGRQEFDASEVSVRPAGDSAPA